MDILNKTAYQLVSLLEAKDISAEEITKIYLEKIYEKDKTINAYLTICQEEAIKKAKEIDLKRIRNEKLGSLAGVPIGIKDNICTKAIKTTCGSRMLEEYIPPYNATVVNKLYREDAILLGKLNMDEFGMGS